MQKAFKTVIESLQSVVQKVPHNTNEYAESRVPVEIVKQRGGSMIGPSLKIEGNLVSDEDLVIQGQIKGSIAAKANEIVVGVNGKLKANLQAKIVKVEGSVTGDITGVEKVIIAKTGNVVGNIRAPRVNLEDGAKFKGSIEMDPENTADSAVPTKLVNAAGES
jgi:cytoskeletal protein CcmA (bactofilin family)